MLLGDSFFFFVVCSCAGVQVVRFELLRRLVLIKDLS